MSDETKILDKLARSGGQYREFVKGLKADKPKVQTFDAGDVAVVSDKPNVRIRERGSEEIVSETLRGLLTLRDQHGWTHAAPVDSENVNGVSLADLRADMTRDEFTEWWSSSGLA